MAVLIALPLLGYLVFQTKMVQTYVVNRVAGRLSERLDAKIHVGGVNVGFWNKLILEDVMVEDQSGDTLLAVERVNGRINSLSFRNKKIAFEYLSFKNAYSHLYRNRGEAFNFEFLKIALASSDTLNIIPDSLKTASNWNLRCNNFRFAGMQFHFLDEETGHQFDVSHLDLAIQDIVVEDDTIAFVIDNLKLDGRSGIVVNDLKAICTIFPDKIELRNVTAATTKSLLNLEYLLADLKRYNQNRDIGSIRVDARIKKSQINFQEIATIVAPLKGMDLNVQLSGHIYGCLSDIKGKNMNVRFGEYSSMNGEFYMNGFPDMENAYLYLDIYESTTDFRDISNIRLPQEMSVAQLIFPDGFYDAGQLHYKGNFTGFLSDFVAYGNLTGDVGDISSDLSFRPEEDGNVAFSGHLKTQNLMLNQLLGDEMIGEITMNARVSGTAQSKGGFEGNMDGIINSIELNKYKLKNVLLKGMFDEKRFDGTLNVDDKNLGMLFNGKVDFNPEIPQFNFFADFEHANLNALNIMKGEGVVDCKIHADFEGSNIDNAHGEIKISETRYTNENGSIRLNDFGLKTQLGGEQGHIRLRSDYVDADIDGNYKLLQLASSIKNIAAYYLPSSGIAVDTASPFNNYFTYNITLKDVNGITEVLFPDVKAKTPAVFKGAVNEREHLFRLTGHVPELWLNGRKITNTTINAHPQDGQLNVKLRSEKINLTEKLRVFNLSVHAVAEEDQLDFNVYWNNWHEKTYSGEFLTSTHFYNEEGKPDAIVDVKSSGVYIADSLWAIGSTHVLIDSTEVNIAPWVIKHNNQKIQLEGAISMDTKKRLNLKMEGFSLSNLDLIHGEETGVGGIVNGEGGIFDFYNNRLFYSDATIKNFTLDGKHYGDLVLINKWDKQTGNINSELKLVNEGKNPLNISGSFDPSNRQLDYVAVFNEMPLVVLNSVLENSFSNVKGKGTGQLHIGGNLDEVLLSGDVLGINAGLTIKFPQTAYSFTDTVSFRNELMIFDKISITDEYGNEGVFDGTIRHTNFGEMDYDLSVSSPQLLLLNTTYEDNEQFYGKAFGSGVVDITGHGKLVKINGTLQTMPGTRLYVPIENAEDIIENTFIQFVSKEEEKTVVETEEPAIIEPHGVEVSFDVNATTDASFQIIMDSQTGDVIKGSGNGNLQLMMDRFGKFEMYGAYTIQEGDYLFSLQNVINKNFKIEPGGTINWEGDPYNAKIDVNALYSRRVSLYDLFLGVYEEDIYRQRIPVDCRIHLTGILSNPNIGFAIDFPTAEDHIKDEFQQYVNTEEDLNRQMLSLLILGRFYTPEHLRGSTEYQSNDVAVVGNTASELFSNQLSNWLSQISNSWDFGVNYRPGNEITDDEIELALSTQVFNDKVTINGNVSNNIRTADKQNDFIGDFEVLVKLTRKLQLKAYSRANDNLIYDSSPTTQGFGISYHEEFDSWGRLFRKYLARSQKKENEEKRKREKEAKKANQ